MINHMLSIAIAITTFLCSAHCFASSCVQVNGEPNDSVEMKQKKVEYARAVISTSDYLSKDERCVRMAIHYLAEQKATAAIPRLIELLGYEQEKIGTRKPNVFDRYPAIGGLAAMGANARPALLHVIGTHKAESVQSQNAVSALMLMEDARKNPGRVIKLLLLEADASSGSESAEHFRGAADLAKNEWCIVDNCAD